MKSIIYGVLLLVAGWNISFGQCDHLAFEKESKAHLDEDHFQFIKEFDIYSADGEPIEHSFMLSPIGDYEYWFTGDGWDEHHMTATLYNPDHEPVATNHPSGDENTFLHVIRYHPTQVGIHYIKFEFPDDEGFCGAAVLGFHKHQD